jgi:hypothetical protein
MLVSTHLLISLAIALVLYPFFGNWVIIFFLAGFLIDIDHIIEYGIARGDFNPWNAYKNLVTEFKHKKSCINNGKTPNKAYRRFHIFHSIEFIFLLGIVGFFSKIFFFVFLGFLVHIIFDLIDYYTLYLKHNSTDIGRHYWAFDYIKELLENK